MARACDQLSLTTEHQGAGAPAHHGGLNLAFVSSGNQQHQESERLSEFPVLAAFKFLAATIKSPAGCVRQCEATARAVEKSGSAARRGTAHS